MIAERLDPETDNPFSQIGEGYFAVMLDQGEGMTPISGLHAHCWKVSLSACAETYFAQSEQIPTRFQPWPSGASMPNPVAPLHWRAGGMMLQHMPAVGGRGCGSAAAAKAAF